MARGTKGYGRATRNAAVAVPRGAAPTTPSAAAPEPRATGEAVREPAVIVAAAINRSGPDGGEDAALYRATDEFPMDDTEYRDEVDNEFVRGRMENVVRVATGEDVRVRFGQGFWTDMNGTVQLDPHDPARDAPAEDRIVMMQGGLEHEICHELYYDRKAFDELQKQTQADPSRAPVSYINNILADGHDEWRHKLKRPEAYEAIEAHDALWVANNGSGRWSFDPDRQDTWTQVTGAMLYRGLPYYRVPEERLSPEARAIYAEVAPHVDRAVAGTSFDCLDEANRIHDILKARGVIPDKPKQDHLKGGAGPGQDSPGMGGAGAPPEDAPLSDEEKHEILSSNAGSAAEDGGGDDPGGEGAAGGKEAGDEKQGVSEDASTPGAGDAESASAAQDPRGAGGAGNDDGQQQGEEGQSAAGASSGPTEGGEGTGSASASSGDGAGGGGRGTEGQGFEADPSRGQNALEDRRRRARSLAANAESRKPQPSDRDDPAEQVRRSPEALADFRGRWQRNGRVASEFASVIDEARVETLAPKTRQESGRLDRRRRRALATGDEKVFVKRGRSREVDLSVELMLDVSGSMKWHEDGLRDSAAVVSRGLDEAKIPHEVRGFSNDDTHPLYRRFGEKADWKLGAIRSGGSTDLTQAVRRARGAMSGRKEKQKLAVILTDGQPDNRASAQKELKLARKEGMTVVGIYLRNRIPTQAEYVAAGYTEGQAEGALETVRDQTRKREEAMRELFGGKVAMLDDVRQLPRVAGKKIVELLRRG